jgi:lipopolysaccharide cholinephosphotransferase
MEDNLTAHGVWIDIFPMDAVPGDDQKCDIFLSKCVLFRAMVLSMTTDFHSQKLGKKYFPKRILSIIALCVGKEKIYKSYVKYIKKYDINKEKYVACLSSPYIKKEKIEKDRLIRQKDFEFEGKHFKGPEQWDFYLRKIYGNYMELPPEEERRTHSVIAWRV